EGLHGGGGARPRHSVRSEPVLRLVAAQRLLGAGSELAVRTDAELLLQLLYRLTACSLFKQDQLVEAHRHERIGSGDTIGGKAVLRLPVFESFVRLGSKDGVGFDAQFGLQSLHGLSRKAALENRHGGSSPGRASSSPFLPSESRRPRP